MAHAPFRLRFVPEKLELPRPKAWESGCLACTGNGSGSGRNLLELAKLQAAKCGCDMALILVGTNHKTAPVDVREKLNVSAAETPDFIQSIRRLPGVRGAVILSTCNRVETIVSADSEDVLEPAVKFMAERTAIPRDVIESHLYVLRNRDVVRHLFRVTAGLDSMIVGEPQIGGQVRSAYHQCSELGSLDPVLQKLYEQTMRVSKRVRSETAIGELAVSVPFAAVALAKKIFGELDGLSVMLIGAGEMGELTAQHLNGFGLRRVFVANRAYDRAVELATRFEGEAIDFSRLGEQLEQCDIVIASTAAPHYVVSAADVETALATRNRRNLFLIDLSVPRNLDPEIGKLDGAYLYNVDDLEEVVESNREKRLVAADDAEVIVEKEVELFIRRLASHDAVPTILELQAHLEEIRRGELEKCLRKIGPMTPEQKSAIELLSTSIVNKVLHYPIVRLKDSVAESPNEGESIRNTIRKIFGLR